VSTTSGATEPILRARGLVKHFPVRARGLHRRVVGTVHAVCDVDLDLLPHETLGLVGESGCGKSTTARLLLALLRASKGRVEFQGRDLQQLGRGQLRPYRRDLQIVFQDPFASLDPRMTVAALIAEPLRIHDRWATSGIDRVHELLEMVGLEPDHAGRYPHEFSGGQRQRIGVARALALDPSVLLLDEPVSALDVSVQAGVLGLLEDLQRRLGLAYLFVSHDLAVVRHIADRIAVMYLGRIVELAATGDLFDDAAHPYTRALVSAVPVPDPPVERARRRIVLQGDLPDPTDPPSGCRFRTRCPVYAGALHDQERAVCREQVPALEFRAPGHTVACHFPDAPIALERGPT
jgi:oligopeptide/dipeptide ABC transporter ATP-binding protein